MRKILEDFMALVMASQEGKPGFSVTEIFAFYGLLLFLQVLLFTYLI